MSDEDDLSTTIADAGPADWSGNTGEGSVIASLETRLLQQELLADLGMAALRAPELEDVFDLAIEAVVAGLEVTHAKVLRLTPNRDAMRIITGVGWVEALVGEGLVGIGDDSQAGYTLETEAPVIVKDLRTEERFSGPPLLRNHGIVSGVSCIIGRLESPWGVLGAHTQTRRDFSRHDANFLAGVANIIAQTLASKAADDRASEQELRLDLALQAAELAIWQLEPRSGVMTLEQEWERALGLPPNHLGDSLDSFLDAVYPDDRNRVTSALEGHLSDASPLFAATYRVVADGHIIWLSSKGRVVSRDASGRPVRVLGVHENVSDRVRDEERRRELEAQLRHAHKMEAVGRLAGGVAHDFNNILTTITGYSELILSDTTGPQQLIEDLQEIRDAAERARSLTRQLLAFSRQEVEQARVIHADRFVGQMRRILEQMFGERIEVEFDLGAPDAMIMIDPGQFEQLIFNFATNAKDAMPQGGTFRIQTERCMSEGCTGVIMRFSDTGVGIPDDHIEKIFEPFFTTKAGGDGTGLGLSLIYSLVQQAGGEVLVQSAEGRGTTFRVTLPMTDALLEDSGERTLSEIFRGQERILLVEDDARLRQLGVRILKEAGYDVVAAANASQARAIVSTSLPFHMVLSDVVMPGESGPQLVRSLREAQPTLKVLFVSGYNEDEVLHRAVSRNEVAYLAKPFTPNELLRNVRRVLGEENGVSL